MDNFKFAYIFFDGLFGIIWLIIFFKRKDLRREQIFMSFAVGILGLTEQLFYGRYWKPEFILNISENIHIGIESIILCFFYGGIASTLYEFLFNNILKKTQNSPR